MNPLRSIAVVLLLIAAPAAAQPPTMERLWPHDDGRSWIYDQHYEDFDGGTTVDNRTRIFFDGTTVAPEDIAAQYLRQELVLGPAVAASSAVRALVAAIPDPLLRSIWVARPDLRARIEQAAATAPCPQFHPPGAYALLLNGEFAWRRTADEVAAWRCNLPNTRSWRWMISDLTISSTFTLQLVPDLASDVVLRGPVAAVEPVTVPAGTYPACVRIDYVIDYGMSECTDPSGNPVGTYRSETRGFVHYAPDVGPVNSSEQFIPYVATGSCSPGGSGEPASIVTMRLHSPPVPVRSSTWGRLKAAYR